jgi:hypothetical protein
VALERDSSARRAQRPHPEAPREQPDAEERLGDHRNRAGKGVARLQALQNPLTDWVAERNERGGVVCVQ